MRVIAPVWRSSDAATHFPASTRLATVMYFLPASCAAATDFVERAVGAHLGELHQHRQVDAGEHLDVRPVHHRDREVGRGAAEHVGQDHHAVAGVGALHRLDDVAAALLDVVVGADRDGLDLLLLADHVLQGRAELDGKPPVGNENQAYHLKIGNSGRRVLRPTARKGAIMTMCGASARGWRRAANIFCSAVRRTKKWHYWPEFCGAQCSKHEPEAGPSPGATASRGRRDPGDFRNGRIRGAEGAPSRPRQGRRRGRRPRAVRTAGGGFRARGLRSGPARSAAGRTSRRPCAASTCNAVVADKAREGEGAVSPARISASARARFAAARQAPRISTARAPDLRRAARSSRRGHLLNGSSHRRQAHHEARAEHLAGRPVRPTRPCGSRRGCGRHAPRRSGARSRGRGRSSGQSPDAAGRCRSARRSARSLPAGCPARHRRP